MNSNYKHVRDEDELIGMAGVIKRKKWLFIIIFIAVLISGLILSYLKPAQYTSSSVVRISSNSIYYDDYMYRYYPVEAEDLWIFPQWQIIDIENKHLDRMSENIRSNEFIIELKSRTGISVDTSVLKKSIEANVDRNKRTINIYTYTEDPETAFKINKGIINLMLENDSSEKEMVFEDLLTKMESFQSRNLSIVDDLNSKLGEEDYLTQIELDNFYELYSNFEEIKRLLVENKSFFINRLEVIREPELNDVDRYTSFPRDIVISFFSAIAIALIIVFIVNYFQAGRKPSRQIPEASDRAYRN